MNKKGIIALIVVVVLIFIGYSIWGGSDTTVSNSGNTSAPTDNIPEGVTKDDYAPVNKDTTDTTLIGRLKNVSVSAAETGNRVALQNGTAKWSDGAVKGTITLGDIAVEKTVGGINYVLAPLSINTGGSGTFHYVALFEDKNGTLTDKSYALIGDRVKITGIRGDSVSNGGKEQLVVSVSYMDHDQGEPLGSTPTIPRTKILIVEDSLFNPAKEINL